MKIACPYCGAEGMVKRKTPPHKDFTLRCPRCEERFLVKLNLRQYYRKEVEIPVRYSLSDTEAYKNKRLKEGTMIDLSMHGMGVNIYRDDVLAHLYRKGRAVTVFFSLPPRDEELTITGEITRISAHEKGLGLIMGIRFTHIDPFAQQQIGFFLLP